MPRSEPWCDHGRRTVASTVVSIRTRISFTRFTSSTSSRNSTGEQMIRLPLACHHCNLHKGPNLTAIDPESQLIVSRVHPRQDECTEHFSLHGPLVPGLPRSAARPVGCGG